LTSSMRMISSTSSLDPPGSLPLTLQQRRTSLAVQNPPSLADFEPP
jgi:hypothetical protein